MTLVKTTMDQFMKAGSPEPRRAVIMEDAVIKAVIPDGTPISSEFRGGTASFGITASADHVVMLGSERPDARRSAVAIEVFCRTAGPARTPRR